ncbi:MAG: type II secretion system F family protein [Candidatus Omnitrophota bacterium]
MSKFIYKAKRGPGEILEGKIEAENKHQAAVKLSGMGLYALSVEEETSAYIKKTRSRLFFLRNIPLREISNFTRQLSNLLDAGLTMLSALGVLIEQSENPYLKQAVQTIRDDIRDGTTFSRALAKHPKVFSNLYVNMAASGEISGALEDVLRRLSEFLEKDDDTISKIRSSFAYPSLMAFVGFLTIFVLLSFVAPRLTSIFIESGQALPLPTQLLIGVSSFFARFWLFIIAGIICAITFFVRWVRTKEGKIAFDALKLKAPLISSFILKAEIARFSRTLATLIANGVPIIEALGVGINTISNNILRQELEKVRKEVIDGARLSASIKQSKYFPSMMINMIAVGEESGGLERALFKIADTYDIEIDRTIKSITSLIEPSLILFMGIVVGFIVIAMLLPIFQLNLMVR